MENALTKFSGKIHKKLEYLFRIYILSKPRAKGIIQVSVDNANIYFGNIKDIKVYKLIESEDFEIKKPKFLEGDFLSVINPFENELKSVVIDTTNPKYSFRNSHILNGDLNVLYEPNVQFNELSISTEILSECKKITGTVAYLSNSNPYNYGHWWMYTLPTLRVYWKFISKQEIDYYYIGDYGDRPIENFKVETLAALGIKKEQIINFPCQADRSITCVIDRGRKNGNFIYPDIFAYKFTRQLFLPREISSNSKYPKRVYLKRGNVKYRYVVNDNEVVEFLESLGFEALIMDGRTIEEQANIFYNADVIVSACGSALTNLVFARENIKIIEIFPFSFLDGFFFALASYAKADYYYIVGDEIPDCRKIPLFYDIKVNINKLKEICKLANIS